MTDAQWRVFGILLAALTLSLTVSPRARKVWGDLSKGDFTSARTDIVPQAFAIGAYGVAIVVLIVVAEPAPTIATLVAVIILVELILGNSDAVGSWLHQATSQIGK